MQGELKDKAPAAIDHFRVAEQNKAEFSETVPHLVSCLVHLAIIIDPITIIWLIDSDDFTQASSQTKAPLSTILAIDQSFDIIKQKTQKTKGRGIELQDDTSFPIFTIKL